MRPSVDYLSDYDHFGSRRSILPPLDEPAHFIGCAVEARPEDRFIAQADRVEALEAAHDRHRDRKINAAIGRLEEILDLAKQGIDQETAIRAAAADLIISNLLIRLRVVRDMLPLDRNSPEILAINADILAAELA